MLVVILPTRFVKIPFFIYLFFWFNRFRQILHQFSDPILHGLLREKLFSENYLCACVRFEGGEVYIFIVCIFSEFFFGCKGFCSDIF